MDMKKILAAIAMTPALGAVPASAPIVYPDPGQYNMVTYTFVVQHTGDVKLYFAGADAGNENTIDITIAHNGSDTTSGWLFDDKSAHVGDWVDAGSFTKGDIVTFELDSNG